LIDIGCGHCTALGLVKITWRH